MSQPEGSAHLETVISVMAKNYKANTGNMGEFVFVQQGAALINMARIEVRRGRITPEQALEYLDLGFAPGRDDPKVWNSWWYDFLKPGLAYKNPDRIRDGVTIARFIGIEEKKPSVKPILETLKVAYGLEDEFVQSSTPENRATIEPPLDTRHEAAEEEEPILPDPHVVTRPEVRLPSLGDLPRDVVTSIIGAPFTAPTPAQKPAQELPALKPPDQPSLHTAEITNPSINMVDQVSEGLRQTNSTLARFETTPEVLVAYIQSIELPFGARIAESTLDWDQGRLRMAGKVNTPAGEVKFRGLLGNNPSGGLVVSEQKVDLDWKLKAAGVGGKVEDSIRNINTKITGALDKQLATRNPGWEVAGFRIAGNKLQLDFRRTSEQQERQSHAQDIQAAVRELAAREGIPEEAALERIRRGNPTS